MNLLSGKNILLGVCGSIAAYKAVELASLLNKSGAKVSVILTSAAEKFISPLTFRSVTGGEVFTDSDLWGGRGHILHVDIAHTTDLFVIAPATANTLAKLANGLADNLLTISALSTCAPKLVAPAMDAGMYIDSAAQKNTRILTEQGVFFAGPVEGRMASGLEGLGRFMEPIDILDHVRKALGTNGILKGKRLLITAGGSQEPIDPVRVITNRSSGRQGYALAAAALDAGAEVTLISHPTALRPPVTCQYIQVNTAAEMLQAVLRSLPRVDGLVMAAAVADFTPSDVSEQKIKKSNEPNLTLNLKPTTDILAEIGKRRAEFLELKVVAGFAAESQDLRQNALEKLKRKKLDLIAANDITAEDAGFGVETNQVTLFFSDGRVNELPNLTKHQTATEIINAVAKLLSMP
ncbi:MAG TPA: bifunctional phosphopantothenoylcysteine decarboxylase/phosphopantothenate--cysteine ligase CoaBC [Anaerolineales bacterium]|nr:bifunctional phosphopantothenoylcysteine decarboxylase/phosphopantothenate--cysteine ligase CoaBC [Anaerolineales bacterium]